MARATRAELIRRVQELEKEKSERVNAPPDVQLITIAHNSRGQLLSSASTPISQAVNLRALKAALAQVVQQVDGMLLAAVEKEAGAAAWADKMVAEVKQMDEAEAED